MTATGQPLGLEGLQRRLVDTIYGAEPDAALMASIRSRGGVSQESLLEIYRNATRATLSHALRLSYPVVERLVGTTFFDGLASDYLASTPSRSGDLDQYGADFGPFLDRHRSIGDLPYLGDVARLEWLVAQLQRAPVVKPLDREQLAAVPPEELADLRLALVPRAALFESAYPAVRVWEENRDTSREPGPISLDDGPCRALVVAGEHPVSYTLTAGGLAFYACFRQTATLASAVEAAMAADRHFNIADSLGHALRSQSLCIQ